MSVNYGGFVLTQCKDAMLIAGLFAKTFDKLISDERKREFPDMRSFAPEVKERYTPCETRLVPSSDMVQLSFTFRGERRTCSVFFDCDCDRLDWGPKSVSYSMGSAGYADLFIRAASYSLSVLGEVWVYDESKGDADDVAERLDEKIPTLADLASLGFLNFHHVPRLVAIFKNDPRWSETLCYKKVGLSENEVDLLDSMEYDAQKALFAKWGKAAPRFLEDYYAAHA